MFILSRTHVFFQNLQFLSFLRKATGKASAGRGRRGRAARGAAKTDGKAARERAARRNIVFLVLFF